MHTQHLSDFLAHDHLKFRVASQKKFRAIQRKIKRRRLWWLGYILRMSHNRIPMVALRWTPQGKRKEGRFKATWRKFKTKVL